MKTIFRVGAVGTGNIFTEAHIPAYVDLRDRVRCTALFNPTRSSAERARQTYLKKMDEAGLKVDWNVDICDTPEELFSKVDIVDNCSPSRWHASYSIQALSAGVHVMSEKPMARNGLEAEAVVRAAARSKALYQLNDDNVFLPRYQHYKNMVGSGIIGEPVGVWLTRGTASSARSEWFFDPLAGGGAILDYGSHAVAGSWFLIGFEQEPEEVRSVRIGVKDRTRLVGGRLCNIETDDDAHFKVLYRNPGNGDWVSIFIESTWSWPDLAENGSDVRGWLMVEGSEGRITGCFDEEDREYIVAHRYGFGERRIPIQSYRSETLSFRDEIQSFVRSVELKVPSLLDAVTCAKTIRVINAAQLSELRGRRSVNMTDLDEFLRGFGSPDDDIAKIMEAGDRIALKLTEPYRMTGPCPKGQGA
ncbi:MAG: Gfo/Idh/MocA family oxidoreductase [Synergistaceae bacterium]|nr:Gfo/Idh/MocA family oxidoreductase [Synergistaceae bacterium]